MCGIINIHVNIQLLNPEFKIQEIFPERFAKSDKQTSAEHEFIYKICKSRDINIYHIET